VDPAEPRPAASGRLACLWLALVCLAALWTFRAALGFDFIAIDDKGNLTLNPHMGPPSLWNLRWMFTNSDYVRRYMPLGWLGFSAVFAVSGLSSAGYHAANLALHVANTALLFAVLLVALRRWNGRGDDSWNLASAALGAALWALHPFRAESIGWASGMLYGQAGLFALAAVLAYLMGSALPAGTAGRRGWLGAAAAAFLASLLTYPLAVGLVAVFYLIDLADGRPLRLADGKGLFVLAAAAVGAVTVAVRYRTNAMWPAAPTLSEFPLSARVMQAFYMVGYYVWKTLAPTRLTPTPTQLYEFDPLGPAFLASALGVVALTAALWLRPGWRRGPLLAWLAYVALVLPVAGLTEHPHYPNDRYSYLTGMVLVLGLAFALARIPRGRPRAAAGLLALAAALVSAHAARAQLGMWRNSDSVFLCIINRTRIASVRKENFSKWAKLSADIGRFEMAKAVVEEWDREYPDSAPGFIPRKAGEPVFDAAGNLKIAIEAARAGRAQEAEAHFRRSLMMDPGYEDAQYNFAMFLGLHGRPREALHLYFILAGGADCPGAQAEGALLSVIARDFWDGGDKAPARQAVGLALSLAGTSGGGIFEALRGQARDYGVQTLPALRDSTIR
jgi:hypothetical protein